MSWLDVYRTIRVPDRMRHLPVDRRGVVVPWFVAKMPETGEYDFRISDGRKKDQALRFGNCWVCGGQTGKFKTFAIGPMCVVNRTTAEPGSHLACAEFSVRACPFLTVPNQVRRPTSYEDTQEAPGEMLLRNPGVTALYTTTDWEMVDPVSFGTFPSGDPVRLRGSLEGLLVSLGNPTSVTWWREGRSAMRSEVEDSVKTGLPALLESARNDPDDPDGAVNALTFQLQKAQRWYPMEVRSFSTSGKVGSAHIDVHADTSQFVGPLLGPEDHMNVAH